VAVGGFRALTVHVRHLPGLARAIADVWPGAVVPVDVDAEFLEQFRELARENGQDWAKVLRIDGRLTAPVASGSGGRSGASSGDVPRAFVGYVAEVAKRLTADWVTRAAGGGEAAEDDRSEARDRHRILFLHNAGLLARYWEYGGRDLLTALQQSARRPVEQPHGLWLLCPAENPQATPQMDGRLVETYVPDGEWIALTGTAVEQLRRLADTGTEEATASTAMAMTTARGDAAQNDAVPSDEDRSMR
jgi:hypothetical protein